MCAPSPHPHPTTALHICAFEWQLQTPPLALYKKKKRKVKNKPPYTTAKVGEPFWSAGVRPLLKKTKRKKASGVYCCGKELTSHL